MIILGIETSCDETAAAVLKEENGRIQILSNVVSSSLLMHAKYGGVIPEQAAREQIKSIIPAIEEALAQAGFNCRPELDSGSFGWKMPKLVRHDGKEIDAIAVTYGPGLIGSLLVGVETAKVLSLIWNKPLIPVNHLLGHFWANWSSLSVILSKAKNLSRMRVPNKSGDPSLIVQDDNFEVPQFPCIGLLVSGGHTDLVLFRDPQTYEYLGGTRDDAAGECFDKCARVLGYAYPGGPKISKLAEKGNPKAFNLPRPMMEKGDFSAKGGPAYGWDFSFSGLKTAVANLLSTSKVGFDSFEVKCDLAASIEQAIVDVLVDKTIKAAQKYKVEHIMIAGGVAANKRLAEQLSLEIRNLKLEIFLHIPPPVLCTDNGAMIAARGFFEKPIDPLNLQANPNLSL